MIKLTFSSVMICTVQRIYMMVIGISSIGFTKKPANFNPFLIASIVQTETLFYICNLPLTKLPQNLKYQLHFPLNNDL